MRGKAAWLNMLALFAFVVAQLPTNAIASLFQHQGCDMPCCSGVELSNSKPFEPKVSSRCATPAANHSCDETADREESSLSAPADKSCGCEISAPSTPEPPVVALASSPSPSPVQLDAVLPPNRPVLVAIITAEFCPGIFGADSGPPSSRPHCVWLGRAPPVFLA